MVYNDTHPLPHPRNNTPNKPATLAGMNKEALCDALTSKLELKRQLVWISDFFCFSSPYLAPINIPQDHPPQILQHNAPLPLP